MSRGKATFRQSDLVRALKAAKAAAGDSYHVEVRPDGTIVVFSGATGKMPASALQGDEWEAPS